ncbi:protein AF-10-like isoform X2 [Dysidea avara]|uniref:protein AF-10-like isoform X2 n=1 Tax=Dysidea avara TaxID=196820 RepID=UPI0033227064
MNKVCSVCGEGFNSPENSLFICEGRGCHVGVHQACYGIVSPPTSGVWYCRKCESQERAARVKCDLCPKKDGAFKRTDTSGWAHVVCALYIPEASFGNNSSMEPIIVSKIPKDRFSKVCCICEEHGSENQATIGACMTCNKPHCKMAFHVTCAQKARLLSEEEDPRDPNNVLYVGYCPHHRSKLDKHNYSNLRRQSLSQNLSSPAPASPVLSPFPPTKKDSNVPSLKTTSKTSAKRDRDANEPPPPRRRAKRRKLSSSTESNVSEDFAPAADSVEDTDSVKQPLGLSTEELSVVTSSSNNASGSSTTNSRNPSISTIEKDEKDLPILSPKSVESNTQLVEVEEKTTVIETEETISVREESVPPVEQEVVTADCIEEAIVDDSSTMVVKQETPAPSKKPASQRGKRKSTAGMSKRDGGSGVPRRRSTVKQRNASSSQNKGSKKNSSRQQSQQQTLPPPTSLTELLERQWEQTAQFVMDQSSRQSNAGTMLSRLYQLQTENQQMQERITNLAAQREFLLATNSQLGSIITESQNQQQHTTNGITEPSYGMQLESSDSVPNLPTTTSTSSIISSTDFNPTTSNVTYSSSFIIAATTGATTSGLSSVLVQASNADVLSLPTCTASSTSSGSSRLVITAVESVKPKEQPSAEKKKQRTMKHQKQSAKLHHHHHQSKGNPVAMPGSVSVIGPPVFPVSKYSEGSTPHSSILIGNLVSLEPSTGISGSFMANSQVGVPLPRTLPPFSEIAMELNGKTVLQSRDITAVTNTIGGSIPAMSPVVSGHNVVL